MKSLKKFQTANQQFVIVNSSFRRLPRRAVALHFCKLFDAVVATHQYLALLAAQHSKLKLDIHNIVVQGRQTTIPFGAVAEGALCLGAEEFRGNMHFHRIARPYEGRWCE
mmetsp:Transcript_13370/g.25965  ORF Transcript_13370/g.25965 Transcript_13370/m.25965 type:complete len:110 (+) Transcript_13370:832-1161(+)